MTRLTVDATLRAKLNGLDQELELCDESGRPLGHFVPDETYRRLLYAWVESQCPFTEEEMSRRSQETGGRSLSEIWKRLGAK